MYEYRKLSSEQKAEVVRQRLQKCYPPHSPPHPIQDSSHYLLTATCYEPKHRLDSSQRRQELLSQLFETFIQLSLRLAGKQHQLVLIKKRT